MSAAWPQVVGWLNTTLPTLWSITGFDGPPNTGDLPVDYVTVGWTKTGEVAGEFSVDSSEDGLGEVETGYVLSDLICQTGDDQFTAIRQRGFDYFNELKAVLRADATLGGILSVNATVSLTNVIVQNISNKNGLAQPLVLRLDYSTVVWPD